MRLRHILAGSLLATSALLLAAASLWSCLEDLPEPTPPINTATLLCPPEAQREAGSCMSAGLIDAGCLPASDLECLTGPRSTLECQGTSECPVPAEACYVGNQCPKAVTAAYGDSARCFHLPTNNFGGGEKSSYMCLAGCAGCAAVCDGTGPVLGGSFLETDAGGNFTLFGIEFNSRLPDTGKVGVYLRLRGEAALGVFFFHGELHQPPTHIQLWWDVLFNHPGSDFEQRLFPDPYTDAGRQPYEWSKEADKPEFMVLAAVSALIQIDCVVPFVIP